MHWPETAITISLASLAISAGNAYRTYRQDIHEDRKELRTLLQRLVAIPREKIDATTKYAGNREALFAFDQICNQENTLLSRQAAEIARRLKKKQEGFLGRLRRLRVGRYPAKYVSATEFLSIGFALQGAYNLQGALEFLQYAVDYSVDFNDEIAALRTLGYINFLLNLPDTGRQKYRAASQIFGKYPAYDQYTQATANIQTELNWATAEASINDLRAVYEHLDRAEALVNAMPYSPGAEGWKVQVAQARHNFTRPQAPQQPSVVSPFPVPVPS